MTDATMTRRRDAGSTSRPAPRRALLSRRAFLAGTAGGAALALAGCATGTKQLFTGGSSGTTITVAIVSNSQMQDAISLSHLFESEHPGIHRQLHLAAGERGPRQDHRGRVHPGRRVRRGDDQQLRDADVVGQRLAGEPPAVHDATPGYDAERLPAPAAGDRCRTRATCTGAVLRRVVVPHVPQGPDGQGGDHDAGAAHLGPGGRRSPPRCTTTKKGLVGICLRGHPGWARTWRRSIP